MTKIIAGSRDITDHALACEPVTGLGFVITTASLAWFVASI